MKRVRSVSIGERTREAKVDDATVIASEVKGAGELMISTLAPAADISGSGRLHIALRRDVEKTSRERSRIL